MPIKPSYNELENKVENLEKEIIAYQQQLVQERARLTKKPYQTFTGSDRAYKTILNSSADAISILDLDTQKFIDCNKASLKLHGIEKRKDFLGLTPDQLSPENQPNGQPSKALANAYIQQAFDSGMKIFEWTHCKMDGSPVPVIVTLSPLLLGDKRLVLAVIKDISERKKAEEAREILFKTLQGALQKVKTLSGMLPICSKCKKIRDDKGYWNQIEAHIEHHTYAKFSHGICPECSENLYGEEDWYIEMKEKTKKE